MRGFYGILGYVTLKGGVRTKNMGKPKIVQRNRSKPPWAITS